MFALLRHLVQGGCADQTDVQLHMEDTIRHVAQINFAIDGYRSDLHIGTDPGPFGSFPLIDAGIRIDNVSMIIWNVPFCENRNQTGINSSAARCGQRCVRYAVDCDAVLQEGVQFLDRTSVRSSSASLSGSTSSNTLQNDFSSMPLDVIFQQLPGGIRLILRKTPETLSELCARSFNVMERVESSTGKESTARIPLSSDAK